MVDPKHIMRLETASWVKARFPIDVDPLRWARWCVGQYSPGIEMPAVLPPARGRVYAYVNHSRWLAGCPFCSAAQDTSLINPIFWCAECGMEKNGGAPMAVVFPPDAVQIESVLMQRPNFKNRNWGPYETLTDLKNENNAHGDPTGGTR